MRSQKARETAWTGMLFALAIALSYLESLVSPLLGLMPAIKLGLSNIVVMYALLFLRTRTALLLVLLKALFAFLTRGATAWPGPPCCFPVRWHWAMRRCYWRQG